MVVRNTGRLSDETRERVRNSMKELGYVYHRGAAMLRTHRSGLIGLLITDVSNPFFAAMTLAFDVAAAAGGYLTMVTDTFDDHERQTRLAQSMFEYPIEALAYTPVVSGDILRPLGEATIPMLAVTRGSSTGAPFLGPDDFMGGQLAGAHLIQDHGYRRIVYLGGPKGAGPREDRLRGLRSIAARVPGTEVVAEFPGITNVQGGLASAEQLRESGIEFDAVVCHSDVGAYALLASYRNDQGKMTKPFGVIGFDGLPESAVFWPPVTSVAVGPDILGRTAAEWLLAALDGKPGVMDTRIPPHLKIRASCGCRQTRA
jgi:LacI family transcriptional regulator